MSGFKLIRHLFAVADHRASQLGELWWL